MVHFILRDFKTYRLAWIVLGILTGCAFTTMLLFSSLIPLLPLGYGYFFFGLLPCTFTGVRFRSQHIMSRNYLLSLPIERRYLFAIIQCRILIFWIPFALLILSLPFLGFPEKPTPDTPKNVYGLYSIGLLACIVWMTNSLTQMQLSSEKITSYVTQKRRALAWFKMLGLYLLELSFVIALVVGFLSLRTVYDIIFVALLVGAAWMRFYFARKSWLHNQ